VSSLVADAKMPTDFHDRSRIPLRWMIRECFDCHTGILFDMDMLKDNVGMNIDSENGTYVSVFCETNAT
jgi:hypothetical protein